MGQSWKIESENSFAHLLTCYLYDCDNLPHIQIVLLLQLETISGFQDSLVWIQCNSSLRPFEKCIQLWPLKLNHFYCYYALELRSVCGTGRRKLRLNLFPIPNHLAHLVNMTIWESIFHEDVVFPRRFYFCFCFVLCVFFFLRVPINYSALTT